MTELPTGTVTFLFTDVEGSTRLLRALGSDRYADLLATHNELLRAEFEREEGLETHHQGDSFVVVFRSAGAAVRAAVAAQRALAGRTWPEETELRVRMGLHTGEATAGRDGYVGFAVHQAARIGDAGHGGQVLLSATTAALVEPDLPDGVRLQDLGGVQLPDLDRPERLFQLTAEGLADRFPPLVKRVIETTPAPGPPLLEREAELETLRAIAEDVQLGNGRVVAIEAGAGMGKTRLIAEMRRIAAGAGIEVLGARGGEFEQQFPFGVVRQLFEPAVGVPERRDELLAGAAGLAAPLFDQSRLADALGQSTDTSFATLHGLYWLTANLAARTPVLLAVDDAHWSDQPSLRWLTYLARRLEGVPVLLLLGLRPPEPTMEDRMLGELVTDPVTTVIRPGALSENAVQLLIRTLLGAEPERAFAEACAGVTGGNPYLLRELLSMLAAEGGPAGRRQRRPGGGARPAGGLAGRPAAPLAPARRGARALEGGRPCSATTSTSRTPPRSRTSTASSRRTWPVRSPARTSSGPGTPSRSCTRSSARPSTRSSSRARPRRRTDERRPSSPRREGRTSSSPRRCCWPARRASSSRVDVLRRAALVARGRGAPESAVTYLRRALEEPPPDELRTSVLYELGSVEKLVHGPSAAEHLREALGADDRRRAARPDADRACARALLQQRDRGRRGSVRRRDRGAARRTDSELRRGARSPATSSSRCSSRGCSTRPGPTWNRPRAST